MISLWIAQASAPSEPSNANPGGGWLIDPELVDPGYSQTIAGGEIQTAFPPPPPPRPPTPEWLKSLFDAIGSFFQWSAPAAKPLMWIAIALVLLFLLYHFVPAFARWVDDLPFRRKAGGAARADSRPTSPEPRWGSSPTVEARTAGCSARATGSLSTAAKAATGR